MSRLLDTNVFQSERNPGLPEIIFKAGWHHGARVSKDGIYLRNITMANKIADEVNKDTDGATQITGKDLWSYARWEKRDAK